MSLSGLSLTNQRLYFAKLQLQQYSALADGESEPARQAQYESVVFHLIQAYRSFLRELAEVQNLPLTTEASSAVALLEGCSVDFVSPELQELAMLETEIASWLAQMQRTFVQLSALGGDSHETGVVHHSEISLTMLTDDDRQSSLTLWLEALSSVIQRLRAVSQEW